MKGIFSKICPLELLHIIVEVSDFGLSRKEVIPSDQFLQLALLKLDSGKTFTPHKHINVTKTTNIAQESWVVIKGRVLVTFYDIDDSIIRTEVLTAGMASVTLRGGHNYLIMENDTTIYEFKTGPYLGRALDKDFINEGGK
jgi:hypothetical protein